MPKMTLFFISFFIAIFPFFFQTNKISLAKAEEITILINKIMLGQNEGAKNEFIELYNPNDFPVDLGSYNLKKKSKGGSESNLIANKSFQGFIPAQGYFLISSPEFCPEIKCDLFYSTSASLSKNNTILLYDEKKNLLDKLGYGDCSDFYQTPSPNPENNEILQRVAATKNNLKDFLIEKNETQIHNSRGDKIIIKNQAEKINKTESKSSSKAQKDPYFINLWDLDLSSDKDLIIVEGIASVLPGVLASQFFYIHNSREKEEAIYGLQIYNYYKNFPEIKTGDRLRVKGELVKTELCQAGEKKCLQESAFFYRLKTKDSEDITILSNNNEIKSPPIEKISSLNLNQISQIKTVSGEITQNKTNNIYLDDGEKEIKIEIKKGTEIPAKSLKEGSFFTISGILSESAKEIKLSPTNSEQIINLSEEAEEYLGEILEDSFWELEKNKQNSSLLKYGLLVFSSLIIYLFFLKKKKLQL